MAILNMITQGSGGGGGGANIGEPLNLTVTASGLDATIKWEDNEIGTIPPTTFQKSELVRKIGSAPTSPSDGDLVVTETVKDTYKVSGYVDSGLTDGETYYYRVFSYSDLGGISYCDAVSVTPSAGGWQPGANTIAYYPLDSTSQGNDMKGSGTAYDLSVASGTVTYPTVGGLSVMASSSGYLSGTIDTIPVGASARTLSVWVYILSAVYNEYQIMWFYGTSGQRHKQQLMDYNTHDNKIVPYLSNHYDDLFNSNISNSINQWYNILYTYDGVAQKLYNNGIKIAEQNITLETGATVFMIGGTSGDANLPGYISNLIIEDRARTEQEVSDYFDQTKGDYGIS